MDLFNQLLGFILGLLSSWAFWRLLLLTKPKIEVAPLIAYSSKENILRIKAINRSRRQAVDIDISLVVAETKDNIQNTTIFRPELKNPHRQVLDPAHPKESAWKLPTSTVFRVSNARKILALLSADSIERRLMLTISATDAMSGTKVVDRITYTREQIQDGIFRSGKTFEIIKIEAKKRNKKSPSK